MSGPLSRAEVMEAVESWLSGIQAHESCTWGQVGPCVYCRDHGIRLYQGELPEDRRTPAVDDYDPDDDPNIPDLTELELERRLAEPGAACGQSGACAYDAEGRPLIHVTDNDAEAS